MTLNELKTTTSDVETQDGRSHEQDYQLYYEAFKHLTTLSTGSILILVALLEKLFTSPLWRGLVVIALICFVVSILSSILNMFLISDSVRDSDYNLNRIKRGSIFISLIGFVLGIVNVAAFSVRNLFR